MAGWAFRFVSQRKHQVCAEFYLRVFDSQSDDDLAETLKAKLEDLNKYLGNKQYALGDKVRNLWQFSSSPNARFFLDKRRTKLKFYSYFIRSSMWISLSTRYCTSCRSSRRKSFSPTLTWWATFRELRPFPSWRNMSRQMRACQCTVLLLNTSTEHSPDWLQHPGLLLMSWFTHSWWLYFFLCYIGKKRDAQ